MLYAGIFMTLVGVVLAVLRYIDDNHARKFNIAHHQDGWNRAMDFISIVSIVCIFFGLYTIWMSGGVG